MLADENDTAERIMSQQRSKPTQPASYPICPVTNLVWHKRISNVCAVTMQRKHIGYRACVDCGTFTTNWCNGSLVQARNKDGEILTDHRGRPIWNRKACQAVARIPSEKWRPLQNTPLCLACEFPRTTPQWWARKAQSCHFCQGVHLCRPPARPASPPGLEKMDTTTISIKHDLK